MLNNQVADTRKVLVELSVIPLGSNGQDCDQIAKVVDVVEETGLFHERTPKGTTIEGDWKDISTVIYNCYERVQEQFPNGFLRLSIR